jgi:hypothetical protein
MRPPSIPEMPSGLRVKRPPIVTGSIDDKSMTRGAVFYGQKEDPCPGALDEGRCPRTQGALEIKDPGR